MDPTVVGKEDAMGEPLLEIKDLRVDLKSEMAQSTAWMASPIL